MATVVFFHAHPDDESIATAGTMAQLSEAGHRVVLVVATRGEVGDPVAGVLKPGEALGDRREREVRRSAELLGTESVRFLGYRDSGMVGEASNDDPTCFWQADVDEAAARLGAILRDVDCDLLVGYDPNGTYGHPDHVQVHRVGAKAASMAGDLRVLWGTANRDLIQEAIRSGAFDGDPDGADDRVDRSQMGMPLDELTHAIDVRSTLALKRASLRAHESQIDESSFFLAMDDDTFAAAFGTEWYCDASRHAQSEKRVGELLTSLFD